MRTHKFIFLPMLLALCAAPALAQPGWERPGGLSEKAYQKKKGEMRVEVRRLEAEYARYADDATGFEGVWAVSGSRSYQRRASADTKIEEYAGEVVIKRDGGEFKIEGKVRLKGKSTGNWKGKGALAGTDLEEDYKASVAGTGAARYTLKADGSIEVTWNTVQRSSPTKPEGKGTHTLVRGITWTRAELEAELVKQRHALQFFRYPRPEPTSYSARSRKFSMAFTPTVEGDPNGVEQQVIDLIGKAEKTIDLAVFEFSLMRVAKALVAAQKKGVRVRMVYDNREDHQEAIKYLRDNNVPIRSDARSAYMHNKFILVDKGDKDIVWTGSTNLAPGGIYIADNHAINFKNAKLAEIYTTEFEEMFVDGLFGVTSPKNTSNEWVKIDRYTKVQVFFAPEDGAMDRLIEVVRGAKKSIRIVAFAFTSTRLFEAIVERMKDGVKVEGIFESRHAGWKNIKIGPLHAAGAKVVFDRNPDALHHKVIVVDDHYLCTGSFNFTDKADTSNDENFLVVKSKAGARAFSREIKRIMSVSDPKDPRIPTAGMPEPGKDAEGILDVLNANGFGPKPTTPAPVTPAPVTPTPTND